MSTHMKKNLPALQLLEKAPKKLRIAVIDNATKDLILALCEVIHNVLIGTVKLSPNEIKRLKPYHRLLVQITKKSTPLKTKKKLLVQKGGFLLTLLPPAIALLTSLLIK